MQRASIFAPAVFLLTVSQSFGQQLEKREYSLAFAIPRVNGRITKEKSQEIGKAFMVLAQHELDTCGHRGIGRMEYDAERHMLVVQQTAAGHEPVLELWLAIRRMFGRGDGTIYV